MNHSRLKYQQFFTTLLLCAYLVGNFSIPIFEGIHFFLHLGDSTSLHSFQSHNGEHNHQTLAIIDEIVSNDSTTDLPTDSSIDNKIKKVVQQLTTITTFPFKNNALNISVFHFHLKKYLNPFLPLTVLPPEV